MVIVWAAVVVRLGPAAIPNSLHMLSRYALTLRRCNFGVSGAPHGEPIFMTIEQDKSLSFDYCHESNNCLFLNDCLS